MALPFVDKSLDLVDMIAGLVRQLVSSDDMRSRVELVKFSGQDSDVIRDDASKVYLRCTSERMRDGAGQPVEFFARLVSIAGIWSIPAEACELVAVVPEDAARAVGAAYVFPMSATPPTKLALGVKAFWQVAGNLLVQSDGFIVKTPGLTFTLKDGKLTIAWANGTRIEGDANGFRHIVVDAMGVATAHVQDATGLTVACAPLGVNKIVWRIDGTSGGVVATGVGAYSMGFPYGFLGVVPVAPIAYGVGGTTASVSWKVQV